MMEADVATMHEFFTFHLSVDEEQAAMLTGHFETMARIMGMAPSPKEVNENWPFYYAAKVGQAKNLNVRIERQADRNGVKPEKLDPEYPYEAFVPTTFAEALAMEDADGELDDFFHWWVQWLCDFESAYGGQTNLTADRYGPAVKRTQVRQQKRAEEYRKKKKQRAEEEAKDELV